MHAPEQPVQRQGEEALGHESAEDRHCPAEPARLVLLPVRVPTLPRPAPVRDPQQWLDLCA
jgi:hypothetical protein